MADRDDSRAATDLLTHAGWLKRLAKTLVTDDGAADDLVQETWLTALRQGPRRGVPLRPWLASVLRNRALSNARSSNRRERREREVAPIESRPSVSELTERAEATRGLVEAVLALPDAQRQVILLRYFEELSVRQIAEHCGMSEVATRSSLARAIAALRQGLDETNSPDRANWMQALAPLAPVPKLSPLLATTAGATSTSTLMGALAMTTFSKIACLTIAAVGIGLGLSIDYGKDDLSTRNALEEGVAASDAVPDERDPLATDSLASVHPVIGRSASREAKTASTASLVRGLLIDAETGDPVPHFALGIGRAGKGSPPAAPVGDVEFAERVVSGADGVFVTTRKFEPGAMHAVLLEDRERAVAVPSALGEPMGRTPLSFVHSAEPRSVVQLRVDVGPSFYIECAEISADRARDFVVSLASPTNVLATYTSTHLIATPRLLARFRPLERRSRVPSQVTLSVLSIDRRRSGLVTVPTRKAWPVPTVSIELESIGSLDVGVESDHGPAPDSVLLELWHGSIASEQLDRVGPDWSGRASPMFSSLLGTKATGENWQPKITAHCLRTGVMTMRLRADGFDDLVETLPIEEGENSVRRKMSRNAAADGWIAGSVRTMSGNEPAVDWVAYAHRRDADTHADPLLTTLVAREAGGQWIGEFRFENLIHGDYDVWIRPAPFVRRDKAIPESSPRQHGIRVNGDDVEFLIQDVRARSLLDITVVEAQGGTPISEFELLLVKKDNGIEFGPKAYTEGKARIDLGKDPAGGLLWVEAPERGAEFIRIPDATGPDGIRRIELRLSTDWGAPVQVMTFDDGTPTPLSGARVFGDGTLLATTDESGACVIRSAARPQSLSIELAGYTLDRILGPIDEGGKLSEEQPLPFNESYYFLMNERSGKQ